VEIIAANPQAFREVALAARGQIEAVRTVGQASREGLLVSAQLLPDWIGEIDGQRVGRVGTGRAELHQSMRIFNWQRAQHDCVEDAENGCVRAYAQRQ
jgi:hypothetical protein